MKSVIAHSAEEAENLIKENWAKGLRIAAMSNCGLPAGSMRITFLPESAFKQDREGD